MGLETSTLTPPPRHRQDQPPYTLTGRPARRTATTTTAETALREVIQQEDYGIPDLTDYEVLLSAMQTCSQEDAEALLRRFRQGESVQALAEELRRLQQQQASNSISEHIGRGADENHS